jgi:pyruvate/2-oxoglutarate dehydrogenase complex dihydrolipoamide acyltransferase (E2) component
MTPTKFRAAGNRPVEIATGATFAPGENAPGVDPDNPHDAAEIEAGRLVELVEPKDPPEPSEAVVKKAAELQVDLAEVAGTGKRGAILVADVQKFHDNKEASK